jgi:hypothetical protein
MYVTWYCVPKAYAQQQKKFFHAPNITQNTKWNNYEDINTKEETRSEFELHSAHTNTTLCTHLYT